MQPRINRNVGLLLQHVVVQIRLLNSAVFDKPTGVPTVLTIACFLSKSRLLACLLPYIHGPMFKVAHLEPDGGSRKICRTIPPLPSKYNEEVAVGWGRSDTQATVGL